MSHRVAFDPRECRVDVSLPAVRLRRTKPQASEATRKIRVLIVDDEISVRSALEAVLRLQPDVEVIGFSGDGADAVAFAEREKPDVVVLDLLLPKMDGAEAAKSIAVRSGVVMVSGSPEYSHKTGALDVVDAFLSKPVDPQRLVQAVRRASRAAESRRRLLPRTIKAP